MKKTILNYLIYTLFITCVFIIYVIFYPPKEIIKTTYIPVTIEKEVVVEKEVIVEVEKEVIKEIEKEVIKEVEVIIEKEPEYMYNITSVEREMLARLVYLEVHTEGMECQKAVASVIINRWQNGYWGDNLYDVIYADNQFSPASNIYRTTPYETDYQAVDYVLKYGCTIPSYILYFRADYGFSTSWTGYREYVRIENVYFGYFIKDK